MAAGPFDRAQAWFDARLRRELRAAARDVYLVPRRVAARRGERMRPTFLILGAQKAGTTSLFRYLAQHPRVVEPIVKEVHFFDASFHKGLDWYLAHFPRDPADGRTITGEGSPYYLYHPHCADRIAETFPEARLLVLLRNPIDRAVSHHGHERRQGGERRPMQQAFDEERARVPGAEATLAAHPRRDSRAHRRESYLSRGIYAPQLERYLARFPREQLLVQRYDRFFAEPGPHFARVLEHLGLGPVEVPFERHGGGDRRPSDQGFDRAALAAFFRPHNERLSELLGEDFTDWQ
ncbi:MAG TPA: sulfotransferase [Polyangiaceae bacterium LLY-WYZ-14_1]|nr:sulfotransferase [Polyangiaceae bacterium LLY-WYZ-14_1]